MDICRKFTIKLTSMDLRELEVNIRSLASFIDAPNDLLPTFGVSKDGAHPHIELMNQQFHFVVVEKGREIERLSTNDLEQLIYWIFEDITFTMASKYELKNRQPHVDSRRLIFKKQIELLGKLSKKYSKLIQDEIDQILINRPYKDELF